MNRQHSVTDNCSGTYYGFNPRFADTGEREGCVMLDGPSKLTRSQGRWGGVCVTLDEDLGRLFPFRYDRLLTVTTQDDPPV